MSDDLLKKNFIMFYDESNNVRYLSLSGEQYNIDNDPNQTASVNFILAGIAKPASSSSNCDELFNIIKLQPSAPELKFKQIAKGAFDLTLKSKQLNNILKWLVQSDYYLHYFNLNMEYWAFVDIIDDVIDYIARTNQLHVLPYGNPRAVVDHYKDALYRLIKLDKKRFLSLMTSFNYPNIKPGDESLFIRRVNKLLKEHLSYGGIDKPKLNPKTKEVFINLSRLLNCAKEIDELTLTINPTPNTLIDGFSIFYSDRCKNFSTSTHIFDKEDTIITDLESAKSYDDKLINLNYSFSDSKSMKEIQVCDVVCGLLNKYFSFIESKSIDEIREIKKNLSTDQMDTLTQLQKFIEKSDEVCKELLFYVMTTDEHDKHRYFMFDK